MVAAALGGLVFKMKSLGVGKASAQLGKFQGRVGDMQKKMGPQMKKLTGSFKKFGLIAGGVFGALTAASPLLRARMEILTLRIGELVRVFGDALAPVIEGVTILVEEATKIWSNLPEPLKKAILFGTMVAGVVGIIAIAFGILGAAMSPVTLVILAIVAAFALLHLAWTENLGGFADAVKNMFGNVIKIFENLITFFKSIFAGDLSGAWEAIENIFQGAVDFIVDYVTFIPKAILGIIDFFTGGIVTDMFKAGDELFKAFIKGVQKALEGAAGIIGDLLNLIMDFLGGSLPERGPLVKVPQAGMELGQAYIDNIGRGFERGNLGDTINRNFNIDTIALSLPGLSGDNMDSFAKQFDAGIRRSTI